MKYKGDLRRLRTKNICFLIFIKLKFLDTYKMYVFKETQNSLQYYSSAN